MQVEAGLLKVAKEISDLRYSEMMEMAGLLISSIKSSAEDGAPFDPESDHEWCELLRWWAEGYIDTAEDR